MNDRPPFTYPYDADFAAGLLQKWGQLDGAPLLDVMIADIFPRCLCVSTGFGIESAVLLALVARIDPATPILFLDTHAHFPETLHYRDCLSERLGLSDVRTLQPAAIAEPAATDVEACCHRRKVLPLTRALKGFDAWVTGRKRHHGGARRDLEKIEWDGTHIKINPLADWGPERIAAAFIEADLPPHPLAEKGYTSIGCAPCTQPSHDAQDIRAGRWRGSAKTECGIHTPDATGLAYTATRTIFPAISPSNEKKRADDKAH